MVCLNQSELVGRRERFCSKYWSHDNFVKMSNSTNTLRHMCIAMQCHVTGYQIIILVHFMTMLVAIGGNGITCLTIFRRSCLQEATYYLVCSLSTADFLIGLVYQPSQIVYIFLLESIISRKNLSLLVNVCYTNLFVGYFLSCASILGVVGITIDRFVYIVFPYYYVRIAKKRYASMFVALSWIISLIYAVMPFIYFNSISLRITIFVLLLSSSFIALAANIYFYRMTTKLHTSQLSGRTTARKAKHQRQLSFTILLLAAAFGLLWLPHGLAKMAAAFAKKTTHTGKVFFFWTLCMTSWNSAVNVLIYARRNTVLRREVMRTMGRRKISYAQNLSTTTSLIHQD